jgi:beta-aspartyl-peptidase (threonine type)
MATGTPATPAIVGSGNGLKALRVGIEILRSGGSALDAVEACCRYVEDDPEDHYVGSSAVPNVLGVVELDGSIMDGTTRRVGAVVGLRNYPHAVTVARAVMERLPHVMLAGEGAELFAREIGEERKDLTSPETVKMYAETLSKARETPLSVRQRSDYAPVVSEIMVTTHGTVDFIAIDRRGNIASAVSTSGWPYKYPGRVGDSGVIGAGNYSDSRYGGVATVGLGELAIRLSTARTAVERLAQGLSPRDAATKAIEDINALPEKGIFTVHILGRNGEHAAAANIDGRKYSYMDVNMEEPADPERIYVTTASPS